MKMLLRGLIYGAVCLLFPSGLIAQAGRVKVKEGNKLFTEEKYVEARGKYIEALKEVPNSPLIRFDEAGALYKTDEFEQAMAGYQEVLESEDDDLQSQAWYNVGNVHYRSQKLDESIEAYKQSLRIDPNDYDAKHNLEVALRKREQQKQQQQDKNKDKNKDQQNQDKKQQQKQQKGDDDRQKQNDDKQNEPQEKPNDNKDDRQNQQQNRRPKPNQMSREQAERLLQAIKEDPNKIKRQVKAQGRPKVKKDW